MLSIAKSVAAIFDLQHEGHFAPFDGTVYPCAERVINRHLSVATSLRQGARLTKSYLGHISLNTQAKQNRAKAQIDIVKVRSGSQLAAAFVDFWNREQDPTHSQARFKSCGTTGKLFCDSLSPFCPPGIFGNPHGGGSSGSNPNDPDEDPEDPEDHHHTMLISDLDGKGYPQYIAASDAQSLDADMNDWFAAIRSSYVQTVTVTKTKKPTTSTTVVVVPGPPPPKATCDYWYEFSLLHFRISGIMGWAEEDRGRGLHDNEERLRLGDVVVVAVADREPRADGRLLPALPAGQRLRRRFPRRVGALQGRLEQRRPGRAGLRSELEVCSDVYI
ncbi:class V chitinase [Apiospora rasikravindrae]|uniref:Class V chitinase n=1 Tax=Apiospora rasikravindrae TaxID=990691 RepID=A0ABR1TEJ5_9PEZI